MGSEYRGHWDCYIYVTEGALNMRLSICARRFGQLQGWSGLIDFQFLSVSYLVWVNFTQKGINGHLFARKKWIMFLEQSDYFEVV